MLLVGCLGCETPCSSLPLAVNAPAEGNESESNSRQVSVSQICTKPCVTLSTCLSNTNVQRLNFQAAFRVTKTKRASGAFSHCEELTARCLENFGRFISSVAATVPTVLKLSPFLFSFHN